MTDSTVNTRKQYIDKQITHRDYYSQFVTENTRSIVRSVFGLDRLTEALREDERLNSIPLNEWDALTWHPVDDNGAFRSDGMSHHSSGKFRAHLPLDYDAIDAAGEGVTRAVLVCIAKEAAHQVIEEGENEKS